MNPDQNNNYWQPQEPEPSTIPQQPVQGVVQQPIQQPIQQPTQPTPEPAEPQQAVQPQPVMQPQPIQSDVPIEQPQQPADEEGPTVTWTAQEYVHIEKNALWYVIFAIVVLGLIALDIFVIQTFLFTFSLLVIVMAITVIVYARRPPRTLTYVLTGAQGLYVGEKLYHLNEFKGFGLIEDQGHHSIIMIPRKRFSLGVSVFFPEEAGERIVDILGQRLPMQNLKLDVIDLVVRKLRL